MVPEKPLMLKDYLDLDTESSNAGFQCYPRLVESGPTVRRLLDVELRNNGRLVRTRSRNTLNKISSAIKFRFFQKQEGFLSRSISRKLKGSFWRMWWQENNDCKMRFEEEMERRSFSYPSPVVSSFRSWLEMENESDIESESPLERKEIGAVSREEKKIVEEREAPPPMERCLDVEKEQLSPVSVLDFPFDEEEEEDDVATATTSSPPFHRRSTANNTERTKLQTYTTQKSKRFDNIAELDPIDLEDSFNAVESRCDLDAGENAWDLLSELGTVLESSEQLLIDFFIEGLSSNVQQTKLLNEARDWMNGEGWRWELRGCRGELEFREIEKSGNWRSFDGEEKPEVSIDIECVILGALVQELVYDMLE